MDGGVIPQTRQYHFYSRGIIGVIVHGHVINIYMYILYIEQNRWNLEIIRGSMFGEFYKCYSLIA